MTGFKQSKEDFSSSSPLTRVRKLKWWFLLVIVAGIFALGVVIAVQGEKTVEQIQRLSFDILLVSTAYAQDDADAATEQFTPRVIIMTGIFFVLSLVYLAGIVKLFFTKNANQVDTAADLVKTMTGFFVGAATGFLG